MNLIMTMLVLQMNTISSAATSNYGIISPCKITISIRENARPIRV